MLRVRAQTCPRHPEQFMDFNIIWGGGGVGRERDLEITILSQKKNFQTSYIKWKN